MVKDITIYSTPVCGFCKLEKDFLDGHDVKYVEIDVEADQAAAVAMMEKTGQMGVPQTVIAMEDGSEEIIIGFDEARLKEILKLK